MSVTRPAFRGSGMPIGVERATQKPHADMYITNHYTNGYLCSIDYNDYWHNRHA